MNKKEYALMDLRKDIRSLKKHINNYLDLAEKEDMTLEAELIWLICEGLSEPLNRLYNLDVWIAEKRLSNLFLLKGGKAVDKETGVC